MGPLISIRTTNFQYEMSITDAKLDISSPDPGYRMTRDRGSLTMRHRPAKIHIDSTAARESLGLKSVLVSSDETAKRGMATAEQATGNIAREGNQMMDSRNKNVFGNIGVQRSKSTIDTMLSFLPSTTSKVSFDKHQLDIRYEADKLQFDWRKQNRPDMKFTPASIEFHVKQYARVDIEYIGGPIYVPKSSDPNYSPPLGMDVRA